MKFQIEKLFIEGEKARIKFYRATVYSFNADKKCFTETWLFDNDKWIIVNNIIPDIVFDKSQYSPELIPIKNKIASVFKFVNDPVFDEITSNKFITYSLFKNWMPKSYLVYNKKDTNNKLKYLNGSRVIIKPVVGNRGIDVKVLTKKEIKNLEIKKPSLLQEFIDSNYGIKNLIKGCHDLRVIIFNKSVFGSYLRIPRSGSFIANIVQGSRRIVLKKEKIPKETLAITKEIMNKFDCFDNLFYSVDFIFDKKQKPYLLEINSKPGFGAVNDSTEDTEFKNFLDSYYKRIIKYFSEIKIN